MAALAVCYFTPYIIVCVIFVTVPVARKRIISLFYWCGSKYTRRGKLLLLLSIHLVKGNSTSYCNEKGKTYTPKVYIHNGRFGTFFTRGDETATALTQNMQVSGERG